MGPLIILVIFRKRRGPDPVVVLGVSSPVVVVVPYIPHTRTQNKNGLPYAQTRGDPS